VPIAVPLMALVATTWVGLRSLELSRATSADTNNVSREVNQAQTLVKRLELAATMRANAYEKSLDDMRLASIAAVQGKADELQAKLDEIRFNYYRIEPLIATKGQRQELWKNLQDLEIRCQELQADRTQSSAANQPATVKRLDDLRTKIHDQLFQYLYVTTPDEMSWHGLSWPRSAPQD
jgi:DNA repair exonuclease SbcCD ATPase subunit